MAPVSRRFLVIVLGALSGAAAVGLLARDATTLIVGILALGLGIILAILFYFLKPLQGISLTQLSDWPTPAPTWRKGKSTLADAIMAIGARPGETVAIDNDGRARIIGRPLVVAVDNTNTPRDTCEDRSGR